MPPSLRVIKGGEAVGMGLADYIWPSQAGHLMVKRKAILIAKDDKNEPVPSLDRWTFQHFEGTTHILVPCHYLPDPLRPQPSFICLCEERDAHDECVEANHRVRLREALDARRRSELIWWGFEQNYVLTESAESPIFDQRRFLTAERHLGACFDAGLLIHSACFDLGASSWNFKLGVRRFPQDFDPNPPSAIVVSDHLLIARYLMEKTAAEQGLRVEWGALGFFVSTTELREPTARATRAEVERLHRVLGTVGATRNVPHPTHGGVECIEVQRKEPGDPYAVATDVLNLIWPKKPQE